MRSSTNRNESIMATKMTKEEAIKILMGYSHTPQERAALEVLIPELAESEDEKTRKWLYDYFSSIKEMIWVHRDITCEQILAYLEKQKEQKLISISHCHEIEKPKPEWSEEDEKKIIFLERLIEHNVPDGQYGWVDGMKGGFVTKSEAISMLKSLRPSWKPSEEQMKALSDACCIAFEEERDFHPSLSRLYHDLRKL